MKFSKSFIEYLLITLLRQHVNSVELITDEQKFKVIIKFFFKILSQFEIYLNFTK